MEHDGGEHQLVQDIRAGKVLLQLQAIQLLGETELKGAILHGGWLSGCHCARAFTLHALVLPPPYPRDTMHQSIDLLQVVGQLEHVEDLDQRGDHTSVLQDHRIQKLQPNRMREREGLPEEVANLLDIDLAPAQEGGHVNRVVPGHATGHQEGKTEARLPVKDQCPYALELLLELLGSDDRLPRNEERLVLKPASDDVLVLMRVQGEVPWMTGTLLLVNLV
mmetsp:Transcript_72131/g.172290  ORF Transcript_72131/g.172290 Transcript_72131/m.172290 type:complete len:221 (-) Transcript_72131:120-782(-)